MKSFIITVDTEGDNLWNWHEDEPLTTHNAAFVPRFQTLCEFFGFKPVYLTTYEMAMDESWTAFAGRKLVEGKCEIGLHIHAWNSPPIYPLQKRYKGKPFITEYPHEIAYEKMNFLRSLLEDRFGPIEAARSGRFGTDHFYFETLRDLGMHIDCSITPQIDHSGTQGRTVLSCNNYMNANIRPTWITEGVLEVPLTSRRRIPKSAEEPPYIWMRPVGFSPEKLLKLADQVEAEKVDNIEFMIHSSELMPGGSPYFPTSEDIEQLFKSLKTLFGGLVERGWTGTGLTEYYRAFSS